MVKRNRQMKWFRHQTDAHDDEFIEEMMAEFGLESYARWWLLLEAIGAQMDRSNKCSVSYSWVKWQKVLMGKRKKLEKWLSFLLENGKIECILDGVILDSFPKHSGNIPKTNRKQIKNILEIKCKKLLNIRDEYTRKSGVCQDKIAPDTDTDIRVEDTNVSPTCRESNEEEPEKGEKKKPKKKVKKWSEDCTEMRFAKFLFKCIQKNNPKAKEPNFQTWAGEFDKIIRIDERPEKELVSVIRFCQSDAFWHTNILSPGSLRKQYDRLMLRAKKSKGVSCEQRIEEKDFGTGTPELGQLSWATGNGEHDV